MGSGYQWAVGRRGVPLPDLRLAPGQWTPLPGTRGIELLQHSGQAPVRILWHPFGNLPNGITLPIPAQYCHRAASVYGYWDLSTASQLCLIRQVNPATNPNRLDYPKLGEHTDVTRPENP